MSGHSKFSNIKHKKEKKDMQKGKIFTKLGKEISIAIKQGKSDNVNTNSKLRDAIEKAKSFNMPNDTIKNIIKNASRSDLSNFQSIIYEGYGPKGTAIIVETLTDNKNRTAANVKNAFIKGNGSIGVSGCVSYLFDKKGKILIYKEDYTESIENIINKIIDFGVEDFEETEDFLVFYTSINSFYEIKEKIEKSNIKIFEADILLIPKTYVELKDEKDISNIDKIIFLLEEDMDVKRVYTNFKNGN